MKKNLGHDPDAGNLLAWVLTQAIVTSVIAHTGALISTMAGASPPIQGRITLMQDRYRQLAEIFLQRREKAGQPGASVPLERPGRKALGLRYYRKDPDWPWPNHAGPFFCMLCCQSNCLADEQCVPSKFNF